MKKKILLALLAILIIMQFFGIDKSNPEVDPSEDFVAQQVSDPELGQLIKSACYDCHSYETEYPWYTSLAPLSYWIKGHINAGRDELNFSKWATYPSKRQSHKMDESAEMIREKKMPLKSYTWLHSEAKLTDEQKERLAAFFESKR